MYKYWDLRPVGFVSCAHVPCCVNGQCYGVLVPRLSVSEMYAQLARYGPSEILSSVAHHVEYVNLCKNVFGVFCLASSPVCE